VRGKEAVDPVAELGETVEQVSRDTRHTSGFLRGGESNPGYVK
jgi:hypothetical protein